MCLQTFKLPIWNATYRNSNDMKRQGVFSVCEPMRVVFCLKLFRKT